MPFHLFDVNMGGEGELKAAKLVADGIRKARTDREQTEKELDFSDSLMQTQHRAGRVSDEDYNDYLKKPATAKHSAAVAQMATMASDFKDKQLALQTLRFSNARSNQQWSPDPATVAKLEGMGIVAAPTSPHSVQYMDTRKVDARQADSWHKLDQDTRSITGAGLGDWNRATDHKIENGQFTATLPGVTPPPGTPPEVAAYLSKSRKLVAPVHEYDALRQRYQTLSQGGGNASAPRSAAAPAETGGAPGLSPQDQQALDWATANPGDPRAGQIKKRLGMDGGGLDPAAGPVEPDNLQ